MRWMRSTSGRQWLASLLLVSFTPMTIGPVAHAVPLGPACADWIRLQVPAAGEDAVEAALEAALVSGARSPEAFLSVFLETVAEGHPERLMDPALAGHGALLLFLQQRAQGLGGDAVPAQVLRTASKALALSAPERQALPVAVPGGRGHELSFRTLNARHALAALFVVPLRVLLAARPLGP